MKQRVTLALLALLVALPLAAQSRFTFTPATPPLATAPLHGTFYSMQRQGVPPMPFNRFPELPVYELAPGVYLVDDRSVDYAAQDAAMHLLQSVLSGGNEPLNGTEENDPPPAYGPYPGQLWLEITNHGDFYSDLLIHNTEPYQRYVVLTKTNLSDPEWRPEVLVTAADTNTPASVSCYGVPSQFYRAMTAAIRVSSGRNGHTMWPLPWAAGLTNTFKVLADPEPAAPLSVEYRISGTASNGVDYVWITNRVVIPANQAEVLIPIEPLTDEVLFEKSVTLTLMAGAYMIEPQSASVTMQIEPNPAMFQVVASGLNNPIGIDYHAPSESLILSLNATEGLPHNFARLDTNGVVTQWSGISGVTEEVKLVIVRTNAAGFVAGDMYFGNDKNIAWLSADGTVSNLNWCVLTNAVVTNAWPLRGSLCMDETGVFGHDLIAVTGDSDPQDGASMAVWRIGTNRVPILLTNLFTTHLEGVTTLPVDQRYGPWAGKIVTGNEDELTTFAITVDGEVADFYIGISPEDFDIVRPGEDLYLVDYVTKAVLKLPRALLTRHIGDIIISQASEFPGYPTRLFLVRWDGVLERFQTSEIGTPTAPLYWLEHMAFAPADLPSIQ